MGEREIFNDKLKNLLIDFQNSIISHIEKKFNWQLNDMKERINELELMIQGKQVSTELPIEIGDFIECPECAKKPGSPALCPSCLNNRAVIGALKKEQGK